MRSFTSRRFHMFRPCVSGVEMLEKILLLDVLCPMGVTPIRRLLTLTQWSFLTPLITSIQGVLCWSTLIHLPPTPTP